MWRHLLILCLAAGLLAGCAGGRGYRPPGEGFFAAPPPPATPPGGSDLGIGIALGLGLAGGLLAAWGWRRYWLRRGVRADRGRLPGGELTRLRGALEVLEGVLAAAARPRRRRRTKPGKDALRLVERAPHHRQGDKG